MNAVRWIKRFAALRKKNLGRVCRAYDASERVRRLRHPAWHRCRVMGINNANSSPLEWVAPIAYSLILSDISSSRGAKQPRIYYAATSHASKAKIRPTKKVAIEMHCNLSRPTSLQSFWAVFDKSVYARAHTAISELPIKIGTPALGLGDPDFQYPSDFGLLVVVCLSLAM